MPRIFTPEEIRQLTGVEKEHLYEAMTKHWFCWDLPAGSNVPLIDLEEVKASKLKRQIETRGGVRSHHAEIAVASARAAGKLPADAADDVPAPPRTECTCGFRRIPIS